MRRALRGPRPAFALSYASQESLETEADGGEPQGQVGPVGLRERPDGAASRMLSRSLHVCRWCLYTEAVREPGPDRNGCVSLPRASGVWREQARPYHRRRARLARGSVDAPSIGALL